MNILHITASYLPTVNGVSYFIKIIKDRLESAGHRVFVAAPYYAGHRDYEKNIIRFPSIKNPFVKTYPLGIPLIDQKIIDEIRPDVIHVHHPFIFGSAAESLAKKLRVPLFFTAHTTYEDYVRYYLPLVDPIVKKYIEADLRRLAKNCRKVICPSDNSRRMVKKYGIVNTALIFNGIETDFFVPKRNGKCKKLDLIYAGRIEKEKNLDFIADTLQVFSKQDGDFSFVFVGDGGYRDKLKLKIDDYRLTAKVKFAGLVDRDKLLKFYQRADLMFFPSLTEIMPLALIEALSCGLPLVVLKKSNLKELAIEGYSGCLVRADPNSAARALLELKKNRDKRLFLSRNARIHAQNFSAEKTVQKLLKLYQE